MAQCRYFGCDREPGTEDDGVYNERLYCSAKCEVKHDHIKADARDAQAEER